MAFKLERLTSAAVECLERSDLVPNVQHVQVVQNVRRGNMKFSTDRILTTHAGALPQPADLKGDARCSRYGDSRRCRSFSANGYAAPSPTSSRKQIDCGLDIINDGESGQIQLFPLCARPFERLHRTRSQSQRPHLDHLCQGSGRVQRLF